MDSDSLCAGILEEQERLRTHPTGEAFRGVCLYMYASVWFPFLSFVPVTEGRQR